MSASQRRTDLDGLLSDYLHGRDPRLLAEIFRRTNGSLLSRARRWVSDPVLAEDLVQDTFLALLEAGQGFDGRRPAMPYIRGILYRKARRALANNSRNPVQPCATDTPEPIASETGDLDRVGLVELARKVLRVARQLPERYRDVLRLYLQQGKTSREIGTILDRDPGTVRVQVHRGLQLLRNALPRGLAGALAVACLSDLRAALRPPTLATPAVPAMERTGWLTMAATVTLLVVAGIGVAWSAGYPYPSTMVEGSPGSSVPLQEVAAKAADETSKPAATAEERSLLPVRTLRLRWSADRQPAAHVGALLVPLGRDADFDGRRFCSGVDGQIQLLGLQPGSYQLILDRGVSMRLVVPRCGILDRTIEIDSGIEVRGTVVDAAGEPVPAPRIWLTDQNPRYPGGQVVCVGDTNGSFRLRGLRPMSLLGALGPDGGPSKLRLITRRPRQEVRLQLLQETGSLVVQVLDAWGRPLHGAAVLIGHYPRQQLDPVVGGSVFEAGCPTVRGRTTADGCFEASDLPRGWLQVLVRATGKVARLCRTEIPAGRCQTLAVVMPDAIELLGTVVDPEGRPIPGALVHAAGSAPHRWVAVQTDEAGQFRLDGVDPEVGQLDVDAEGFQPPAPIQRDWLEDGVPMQIRLQRLVRLQGHLCDASGQRVHSDRMQVCALASGVNPLLTPPVAHAVDRQGCFVIPDQGADPAYYVRSEQQPVWMPAGRGSATGPAIELLLPPAFHERGTLCGQVTGLPAAALEDALLVLERSGWPYMPTVQMNTGSGRFEIDPVPPGSYRARLLGRRGRFPPLDLGNITVRSGLNDLGILQLRCGTLRYAFELRNGSPIEQMTTWVTDERGMTIPFRGTAGTLALCPGRYRLFAASVSFMAIHGLPFTIRPALETSLPLRLEPAQPRQVRFQIPDGFDAARASAEVHRANGEVIPLDGFDLGPGRRCGFAMVLAPGRYTLRVAAGEQQLHGSFQVTGEAPTTQIEVGLYSSD